MQCRSDTTEVLGTGGTQRLAIPDKAVILAAGFATRLRPLSNLTPKCLMPIWGRPLLEHQLSLLAAWGVRDVLINLHHAPGAVVDFIRGRAFGGLKVSFSFEPEILGTGGALRHAAWFLPRGNVFWLLNGDVLCDVTAVPLVSAIRRPGTIASLWLTGEAGPRTVEMRRGRISVFRSQNPGCDNTYTFTGLHLVSSRVSEFMPDKGTFSIIEAYETAIARGASIAGVCVPGSFWADIGSVKGYVDAHRAVLLHYRRRLACRAPVDVSHVKHQAFLRRNSVRVNGFASVSPDAVIMPGAVLSDTVVLSGGRVTGTARISNSVVGAQAVVRGTVDSSVATGVDAAGDSVLSAAVQRLGWPSSRATAVFLPPRGSARQFVRLQFANKSAIAIRYSLDRPENGLYADNARFLKQLPLRVPEILLDRPEQKILIVEDAGDRTLMDAAVSAPVSRIIRLYKPVLEALSVLYTRGRNQAVKKGLTLCEPFSASLYRWEHELFINHFLRKELPGWIAREANLRGELQSVARRLANEPAVLLHRDLQSTNILLFRSKPVFIDFQGMRLGPAVYDLASLLFDPYVAMPMDAAMELFDACVARLPGSILGGRDSLMHGAIQRMVQAIGAYCRLGASPDTARFRRHVLPAFRVLDNVLRNVHDMATLEAVTCEMLSKPHGDFA